MLAACAALILLLALSPMKMPHDEPAVSHGAASSENEEIALEPEHSAPTEAEPDKKETEPQKQPEQPKTEENTSDDLTCTLSVQCGTAVANKDVMDPGKAEILPENGVIFPEQTVIFYEGESVYDVLLREMMHAKIHMESENTPMYKSAYIKGIANIYEYDCGPLSGWMYKVNGEFPNYGCSGYILKDGDRIEWVYTCDLGADIGNEDA